MGFIIPLITKAFSGAAGMLLAKLLTEKVFVETFMVGFKHLKNYTVNKVDDEIYEIMRKAMEEK